MMIRPLTGTVISLAATFACQTAMANPFGHSQGLRAAAAETSLVIEVRVICQITNDYVAGFCEKNCATNSSKDWLTRIYNVCTPGLGWPACPPGASLVAADGRQSCCPEKRLKSVSSCTPVVSPGGPEFCRIKLCGLADDPLETRRRRNLDTTRYTTPGPRVGPPQPGLRENVRSGGSSVMDRLSGDSPLPASSKPGEKSRDGGSGRAPAGGGASAVAKPVTTPAALPKADLTTDFGKCANCGKPPAPPPR
jgi:hypothetical protein